MTERDALDRLAAANPVPEHTVRGAADSPRARFLLHAMLARPRGRGGRARRWWRYAPAPVAVAAVVVAGMTVVDTGPPPPAPVPPALATPRTVFGAAAAYAERDAPEGDFVHATGALGRVVHRRSAGGYDLILVDSVQSVQPADGRPGEGWVTIGETGSSVRPLTAADAAAHRADGAPGADAIPRDDDRAPLPDLAGDPVFDGDVAELPDDPASAATAMIERVASRDGFRVDGARSPVPADAQGWLFREGTRLLDTFTDVVAGGDRAKIYRMLAGLSGVRTLDTAADPLGRPALGLAYTGATPRHGVLDWQVFLGAGSDRITYTQAVVRQPGPANASLPPGAVQYSLAVTSVTWSDKP